MYGDFETGKARPESSLELAEADYEARLTKQLDDEAEMKSMQESFDTSPDEIVQDMPEPIPDAPKVVAPSETKVEVVKPVEKTNIAKIEAKKNKMDELIKKVQDKSLPEDTRLFAARDMYNQRIKKLNENQKL